MRSLLLAALLLLPAAAEAITITPTGATVDVQYTEPVTNADGTPLGDLDHCNVYLTAGPAPEVKQPNVAATRPQGGGTVTTNVAVTVPVGAVIDAVFAATCTDTSGNESARSPAVTQRLDKLPPAAPR